MTGNRDLALIVSVTAIVLGVMGIVFLVTGSVPWRRIGAGMGRRWRRRFPPPPPRVVVFHRDHASWYEGW